MARKKQKAKQFVARKEDAGATLFPEEELNDMSELKRGPDFVEVTCGCTSKKFGDTIGTLRVHASGHFHIDCKCHSECNKRDLTPDEFEEHSRRTGLRNWKSNIWVILKDKKVSLRRTVLLKYYKHASNVITSEKSTYRRRKFHRDEFIKCSQCHKQRRFYLRNKQECRIYHDAQAKENWICADRPYYKIACSDEEERASRLICRGCPRSASCQACASCICFGCLNCRFWDCKCRACVDFMENAAP